MTSTDTSKGIVLDWMYSIPTEHYSQSSPVQSGPFLKRPSDFDGVRHGQVHIQKQRSDISPSHHPSIPLHSTSTSTYRHLHLCLRLCLCLCLCLSLSLCSCPSQLLHPFGKFPTDRQTDRPMDPDYSLSLSSMPADQDYPPALPCHVT